MIKHKLSTWKTLALAAALVAVPVLASATGTPPPAPSNPLYPPGIGWNPAVDYTLPNFAQSPNLRKFVDSLPGLGYANRNNLGQYIPVAIPDGLSYGGDATSSSANPASDYYEIELKQYNQQMHSDLPASGTALRGYAQVNAPSDPTVNNVHQYLGPMIIAKSYDPTKPAGVNGNGKPVRLKFFNRLQNGSAGNLPLPVDTTIMGAGMGPNGGLTPYTQNRSTVHLHGGATPWISDGTPYQWITPPNELTSYTKGASFQNVPDMVTGSVVNGVAVPCKGTVSTCFTPTAADGIGTYYYSNEQSARLMFYHDHAVATTRLNVYGGMAAPYLLTDQYEEDIISGTNVSGVNPTNAKVLPDLGGMYHFGIPLVFQDKTFVNDANTLSSAAKAAFLNLPAGQYVHTDYTLTTDPLWQYYVGTTGGNLWIGHEYMPVENPFDPSGNTPNGRWDYAPFMVPPALPTNLTLPSPTLIPEGFQDTAVVNGTAFPYATLPPDAVRFRILNACNDRSLNLQMYYAMDKNGVICRSGNAFDATSCTEISMVPASPNASYPTWPTDGRDGGVPDPVNAGPPWIQIGNEGGFLAKVAVTPTQPIDLEYNRQNIPLAGVTSHSLLLLPAVRADVVVDLSQFSNGDVLIVYNDAPAPMPNFWPINDYYTDDPDNRGTGGAPTTPPGFGPNTRTMMQIRITGSKTSNLNYHSDAKPGFVRGFPSVSTLPAIETPATDGATLTALKTMLPNVFAASQPAPIVRQLAYNAAYPSGPNHFAGTTDNYVQSYQTVFNPAGTAQPLSRILTVAGGNNYVTAPSVMIVGGGGTGAAATANLNPIGGVTLLTAGSGYVTPPTITLGAPTAGGIQATANVTISGGAVNAINMVEPGSNYTNIVTAPTCTISAPPAGGTTATCSVMIPTLGSVGSITLTNVGTGYTSEPEVFLIPAPNDVGLGATAVAMVSGSLAMTGKNITEGFDVEYGRMDIRLGSTPNPLTPNVGAGFVMGLARYIDPPTEIMNDGETIIWRLAHLGVDSHAIHFHLFNLQVVNRVDWTNVIKPPYPEEIGWKETLRTNPMEDIIVAIKPTSMVLPFPIPNSNRVLDPSTPLNSTTNFYPVAPPAGVPAVAQQSNVLTNFGWEYVWHCHLLGHEENDMMRPMVLVVASALPPTPTLGTTGVVAGVGKVTATWTMAASTAANAPAGFLIQRTPGAVAPGGSTATNFSTIATVYNGAALSYVDTAVAPGLVYRYQIVAFNAFGNSAASAIRNGTTPVWTAPTVAIATPTTGTNISAPATINLTATATATGSSVAKVEYYYGATLLGSAVASPYSVSFPNVQPGTMSITAKVYTAVGATAVSPAITVNVTGTVTSVSAVTVTSVAPAATAAPGSMVTFNVQSSGGSGATEYRLWVYNPATTTWTSSAYHAGPLTWDTTGLPTGFYSIQVWARNVGSSAAFEAFTGTSYSLAPASTPVKTVTLSSVTPTGPSVTGTIVSFNAAAAGGSGTAEYQLWVYNSTTATWTNSAYGPSTSIPISPLNWNTAGLPAGTYNIQVWARNAGSPTPYEAYTTTTYTITSLATPVASVNISSVIPASPGIIGNTVAFSAAASGGSGTPQYQLWVYNPNTASWSNSSYGPSPMLWNTTGLGAGIYTIQVWARNVGSTAPFEAFTSMTYSITASGAFTSVSLSSVLPASPSLAGTSVVFTPAVLGGSGTPEYQLWVFNPATLAWTSTPYGPAPLTWTTTGLPAGTYPIQIWVRTVGSTAPYESFTTTTYTLQ